MLEPLLFKPVYKDYLWGGTRIAERFGRTAAPAVCAESWELSDRPEGMSVVESGAYAGKTLSELVKSHGESLLGQGKKASAFPLLVKIFDTHQRTSLQVHPDAACARRTGGNAKNEMWYMLGGSPEATVSVGFRKRMTRKTLTGIVENRERDGMETLLNRYPAGEGTAFFIPAGCVHSTEAGCLILEVQQNSDTTYRLWDWNRKGPDGKPRKLHFAESLAAIHWNAQPMLFPSAGAKSVMPTPFFTVERYRTRRAICLDTEYARFDILFPSRQAATVVYGDSKTAIIPEGRACLIPAEVGKYRIAAAEGTREILRIFIP